MYDSRMMFAREKWQDYRFTRTIQELFLAIVKKSFSDAKRYHTGNKILFIAFASSKHFRPLFSSILHNTTKKNFSNATAKLFHVAEFLRCCKWAKKCLNCLILISSFVQSYSHRRLWCRSLQSLFPNQSALFAMIHSLVWQSQFP